MMFMLISYDFYVCLYREVNNVNNIYNAFWYVNMSCSNRCFGSNSCFLTWTNVTLDRRGTLKFTLSVYTVFITKCEVKAGHRYTVHACTRMGVPLSLGSVLLDPSNVTECEIQAGHHYTVHVSARTGVPRSVGSELLDTCIETQYEVQVGHRQVVHVWAHNGCTVARCAR